MAWNDLRKKLKEEKKNDGQDSYLAAVREAFGGSDLAKSQVQNVLRYTGLGSQQTKNVANTLTSGAMSRLKSGDVVNWNRDVARQGAKDAAAYRQYLSGQGTFDSQEYAVNPAYKTLPSSDYLKQLEEMLQMQRASSLVKDDHHRAATEKAMQDAAQQKIDVTELRGAYNDMAARGVFQNGNYTEDDLLYIDSIVNGTPRRSVEDFNALPDDEWVSEYERMEQVAAGVDWDALLNPAAVEAPEVYESQTPTYDAYLEVVNGEIQRRKEKEFFESLANAKDFAQYSTYTDPTPEVYTDNAETMYDLINAQVGEAGTQALLTMAQNENLLTRLNLSFSDNWQMVNIYRERGYDMMTDDEVRLYTYLYNNPAYGAEIAGDYLKSIAPELTMRRREVESSLESAAATSGATAVGSWVAARAADIANLVYLPTQIAANLQGENDPNAAYYDAVNTKSTIHAEQEEALGEIDALNGFKIGGKNILQHLYNIGSTTADTGLGLAVDLATGGAGKVNMALMGAKSFSGGLQESATRGISGGEALLRGGVSAFVGAISEKLGAGPDALTGGGKKLLQNMIGEGAEEVVESLGTTAGDEVISEIFGSQSAFDAEVQNLRLQGDKNPEATAIKNKLGELATDFVYGAAAGGLVSIPGTAAEYSENRAAGKAVSTEGDVQAVVELAKEMDPSTASYKLAQEISARQGKNKKVTLAQLGRLTRQLEADLGSEQSKVTNQVTEDAIAQRLVELGTDVETAKKNAPAIRKVAWGQDPSTLERAVAKWDDNASQVVREMARQESPVSEEAAVKNAAAPEGQRAGQAWKSDLVTEAIGRSKDVLSRRVRLAEAVSTPVAQDAQQAAEKASKKVTEKNRLNRNVTVKEVVFATADGEHKGEFLRFEKQGSAMKAVVEVDGKESVVAVEDMTDLGGAGTAAIIEYTSEAHHDISADEANTMMTTYQKTGGDVKRFITNFEAVYAAGFAGVDAPTTSLPKELATAVYEQAKQEGEKAEAERVTKAKRLRESTKGSVAWLGLVEDNTAIRGAGDQEALSEAVTGMTESQRSTVEVVKAMAEELRVNIVLYESAARNISKLANGKYDSGTHTLYIDVNSGAASEAGIQSGKETNTLGFAMMRTLGHELTHHIESTNAEGYAQYKAAVKKQLQENGQSWTALVRGKIENAAQEGRKLTRMGAEAEVVADASEYMLQESSFTKKLDSRLYAKVKTFVQSFMEKVKEIFVHITGEHRESAALRKVIDGVKQYTGNLQKLWDAALGETILEEPEGKHAGSYVEGVSPQGKHYKATHAAEEGDVSAPGKREWGMAERRAKRASEREAVQNRSGENAEQYSLRQYDQNQIDNWANSKQIELYSGEQQQVVDFVSRSLGNKTLRKKLYFGQVGEKLADAIYEATGVETEGMNLALYSDEVVKIIADHGNEKTESSRGQKAVVPEDFATIIDVVTSPDKIARSSTDRFGKPVIEFVKNTDGKRTVVTYTSTKHNDLRVQTMYISAQKRSLATPMDEQASINTPEASSGTASINMIPRNGENVNRENQEQYSTRDLPVVDEDAVLSDAQFSLRDSSGDEITLRTDEVQENKTYVANMEPVVVLTGNPMAKESGVDFYTAGTAYFQSIGGSAKNEVLGNVVLNEKGIRHLINRKLTWRKTALLRAVKPVIEQGRILHVENDHNNKDTAVIGAVVQLDGQNYYMGVVVSQNDQRNNQYELHDAVIVQIEKKSADALTKTPSADGNQTRRGIGNSSIAIILADLANYNTQFAGEEQFSPRDLTETEQFKRWFGDSKVVNEDGSPKVMYHGTPYGGFTVFKGWQYFTDKKEYADQYQNPSASSIRGRYDPATAPQTYEVYLQVKKPFDTRDKKVRKIWQEEFYGNYSRTPLSERGLPDWTDGIDLVEFIEENGYDYDAIILDEGGVGGYGDEVKDRGVSVVVRDATQIKSAMDNVGTFDPENPDIRYSTRDLPDTVSIREYLGAMKPTSRMTETEKDLLSRYQKKLAELQERERLAAEQDEIIKTAPATSQELLQAKNRYKVYRQQANRIARELAKLERAEGFAGIMATSQTIVNKYLSGATGSVADAQDALETEIKGLTDRLKVIGNTVEGTAQGQRNAFARGLFNQAELNRAAKQLKDSYNSRMSVKAIADRMALAYGEIYASEGAEGAKRFAAAAKELAQDILDSSRYRYRSEILSTIAEEVPTISLTETDLQEIRNAGMTVTEYKRGLSPYVKVAEGASDLSSYVTNAENDGGRIGNILGDDTEGNLAMALYNVIQAERASEGASTLEGMSESESLGAVLADVMSVNLPLSGNSEAISYLRKELKKYAGENEEIAQAIDNAIQSASKATARASAVWREAVKAQGIARQAVEYYRALEEQRRLIELQEQKELLTEQLKTDAAKKLGEKVEAQRKEYREREQKARAYRQNRDEVNKLRRGIGRKVKRLNVLRIRETDQRHVPQELQHVADLVMQTFTDSSLAKLAFAPQQTASLARRYRQLQELESDMTYYWDDEIEQDIDNLQALGEAYTALREREGGVPSTLSLEGVEMETEILQGVDAIVSNVMRMIDSMNDQFLTQRNETFDAFATQTGEDLIQHENAKIFKGKAGDAQMALDELLRTGNMTPIYFFEQLKNGRIMEVYDAIRRGQTEYAHIIRECQDFVQTAKERHHYGSWVGDEKLTMQTSQKHQITLSREQAMWVYATAKREQSNKLYQTEHLLYGGFQYKDTSSTGEGAFRATDKPHQLDTADVTKIGKWLTEEQKAYADEVVGFLSTTMADYGNDASMEMFGYKKFLESYYFPFQTAAAQRFQRGDEGASGESAGTGRVKNSGFTKKLQHKANTTLVMDDFTTVAVDHMQKMATYAAMVQPIENMKRLMNHKVVERDGTSQTIRALIGQKYGKAQQAYLQDFLRDLNGAAQGDNRATKGVDFFINAFKRGAVMASASVVLQQPTAMARAMAMVNPKYFVTNPFYRPGKGVWDEMMKHSGTAVIKDMGKFDVGLGLTASEYISDEHLKPWEAYRRLKAESKLKGGAAAYKSFMDWLTAAPGKADQWTWGLIWQAVKKETAAQNPGMDTGSDAFLDLVGQRFDDVIDHTQVYDSVLTRSNLMRSKNALHKMATSFMSEPTLSINMLYNAFAGQHSKGKRAAIVGSVMASQVLAGAMAALVQAWNDDKDERNWLEKYADRAAGNVLDNINVFGMVPYISDFISLCQGYEVERADMSVISTLIKYTSGFWNKLSNGETLTLKDWENFAGNWANLTGVPAKNILREVRRTINAVTKTDWSAPNMTNVRYAMKENLGVFYNSKNSAYYERLTKAMLNGDTEMAEDLRTYMLTSKMVKEDTIDSGIKTALKNLYADGKLDAEEAKRFLTDNGLVEDEDAAYWEVDKWEWMRETGSKAGDYRKYDDFTTAVESGENLKQVVQTYLDNGVTAKTLAAKITEEYKPRMKELYKTNKTEYANLQARILTAYQVLGYDRDKKLKDIQNWLKED